MGVRDKLKRKKDKVVDKVKDWSIEELAERLGRVLGRLEISDHAYAAGEGAVTAFYESVLAKNETLRPLIEAVAKWLVTESLRLAIRVEQRLAEKVAEERRKEKDDR